VKITLNELRNIIRKVLIEAGGGTPTRTMGAGRNPMSPEKADREALSFLADNPTDIDLDDDDELPSHLRNPLEDPEDCFGPVPPVQGDPYVMQDPFARDTSPLPTPPIKR